MNDIYFMQQALIEAKEGASKGEIPIGAVLQRDGKIIARACNKREESKNPLDHAEMILLHKAGRDRDDWRLNDTTLYVTLEPCPMCLGALFQARVERLVFGCPDPKRNGGDFFPSLTEQNSSLKNLKFNNHLLQVTGGILAEDCARLLKDFFRERRQEKEIGGTCSFSDGF